MGREKDIARAPHSGTALVARRGSVHRSPPEEPAPRRRWGGVREEREPRPAAPDSARTEFSAAPAPRRQDWEISGQRCAVPWQSRELAQQPPACKGSTAKATGAPGGDSAIATPGAAGGEAPLRARRGAARPSPPPAPLRRGLPSSPRRSRSPPPHVGAWKKKREKKKKPFQLD